MNKDAKIGLAAISALVVLLVIFWGRSTFWHKEEPGNTTSSLTGHNESPPSPADNTSTVNTSTTSSGEQTGQAATDQGPVTTLPGGEQVPPSVAITRSPAVDVGPGLPVPTPPVEAAVATTYVVQKGDTLGSLAKKFYGNESQWKLIAEANKVDPKKLQIGQKLTIPSIETTADRAMTTEPAPLVAPDTTIEATRTHVVQKNETLATIAKKYYGSEAQWKLIAEANKVDPKKLQIGQKLTIPTLPTEVSRVPVPEAPIPAPQR